MSKRYENLDYLTALGHNVICARREESPDTRFHFSNGEYDDVNAFNIGTDMGYVERAMGQKSPLGWFRWYGDADTFTSGMTIGQRALMLGYLYDGLTPDGWTDCLECSAGCDECNELGIVPDEMIVRCPACEGDGSTPRGGSCHYCHKEGRIWAIAEEDVKGDMHEDDAYRDHERSLMGEI